MATDQRSPRLPFDISFLAKTEEATRANAARRYFSDDILKLVNAFPALDSCKLHGLDGEELATQLTKILLNLLYASANKRHDYRAERLILELLQICIKPTDYRIGRNAAIDVLVGAYKRLSDAAGFYNQETFYAKLRRFGTMFQIDDCKTWEEAKQVIESTINLSSPSGKEFQRTMYQNASLQVLFETSTAQLLIHAVEFIDYSKRYEAVYIRLWEQAVEVIFPSAEKIEDLSKEAVDKYRGLIMEHFDDVRTVHEHIWRWRRMLIRLIVREARRFLDDWVTLFRGFEGSLPEEKNILKWDIWKEYQIRKRSLKTALPINGKMPHVNQKPLLFGIDPKRPDFQILSDKDYQCAPETGLDIEESANKRGANLVPTSTDSTLEESDYEVEGSTVESVDPPGSDDEKNLSGHGYQTMRGHPIDPAPGAAQPRAKFWDNTALLSVKWLLQQWYGRTYLAKFFDKIPVLNQPAILEVWADSKPPSPLPSPSTRFETKEPFEGLSQPPEHSRYRTMITKPPYHDYIKRNLDLATQLEPPLIQRTHILWGTSVQSRGVRYYDDKITEEAVRAQMAPEMPIPPGATKSILEWIQNRPYSPYTQRVRHDNQVNLVHPNWDPETLPLLASKTPSIPPGHRLGWRYPVVANDRRFFENIELPPDHYIPKLLQQILDILLEPDNIRHYVVVLRAKEGCLTSSDKLKLEPGPTKTESAYTARVISRVYPRNSFANSIYSCKPYTSHRAQTPYI